MSNNNTSLITKKSLKKSTKFFIFGIILLLLSIIIAIGYLFITQGIHNSNKIKCWTTQKEIETLALEYTKQNSLDSYPTYLEDIPGASELLKKIKCPDNGTYTWNPVKGELYCSVHGHHPDDFLTPKSQTIESITQQEILKQSQVQNPDLAKKAQKQLETEANKKQQGKAGSASGNLTQLQENNN